MKNKTTGRHEKERQKKERTIVNNHKKKVSVAALPAEEVKKKPYLGQGKKQSLAWGRRGGLRGKGTEETGGAGRQTGSLA